LLATPAQTITNGDTLKQAGVTYGLLASTLPKAGSLPDGWPAGSLAATRLLALTAGRSIVCRARWRRSD
jgi:hypothetical protein